MGGKRMQRWPTDVTADRLADHYEKLYDQMDGIECDHLSDVIRVLRDFGEDGERRRYVPGRATRDGTT